MNAQNIISALSELLNNNLSISTSSSVTVPERQMAEHLADTIRLVSQSQRVYYEEETTIDIGEESNEDESDEDEDKFGEDKDTENRDPDWSDESLAREKFGLKEYSEDFMREVIDYVDGTNKFGGKRRRSWKSIHNRFKSIPSQNYIKSMSSIHIIISGASSVGKSTLVDECLRKFRQDKKLKNKQFKRIQEVAQKIIYEQSLYFDKEKDNNYLSDRSGFDALAYIHYYFKNEQKVNSIFRSELFQSLINQCQNGLIFIIQPQEDLQAQNDNLRIVPNYQDQMEYTDSLKYWYRNAHLPYFVLADLDLTKRVGFIEKHINGYFHWLSPAIPIPLYLPYHLNKQ
ncbi:unnamed protein product [Rotaria sp. Silwood2]|nr:unnamed protein product [Rotaria sp. Silwood2]